MIGPRAEAASSWSGAGVVIPARNEERLISHCIHSVAEAMEQAGLPAVIVVVAHRCTDDTQAVARRALRSRRTRRGQRSLQTRGIVITDESPEVAGARAAGARQVLHHFGTADPSQLWLLSTDADTTVPADWVHQILRHAGRGAAAVAGLANLASWEGVSAPGREAYRELVAAGIHGESHAHAYAANLAVRADAYLGVGGWPRVSPGEEHALLALLERGGWPVRRPTDVVVTTSGRLHARAAGGLGDLLAALGGGPDPVAARTSALAAGPD